jgi:hypothetical protein
MSKSVLRVAGILAGSAVIALSAAAWLATTGHGVAAILVVTDLAVAPLIGLAVGTAVSQLSLTLPVSVLLSQERREHKVVPGYHKVVAVALLIATLAAPLISIAIWNLAAHERQGEVLQFEAIGVLMAVNVGAWFAAFGLGRRAEVRPSA